MSAVTRLLTWLVATAFALWWPEEPEPPPPRECTYQYPPHLRVLPVSDDDEYVSQGSALVGQVTGLLGGDYLVHVWTGVGMRHCGTTRSLESARRMLVAVLDSGAPEVST